MADTAGMSLSMLCAIHCLALPLALTLLPSTLAVQFGDEAFHTWMVMAVLPISVFALTTGCRQHSHSRVIVTGGVGLAVLCSVIFLGHETLGENGEKWLTLFGASLLALAHFWNFRLCRGYEACECTQG